MVYAVSLNNVDGKRHCDIQLDQTFGSGTEKIYYLVNIFCLLAAPFLAISIFYSAIIFTLRRRKIPKPDSVSGVNCSWQHRKEESAKKVLHMVTAVVVAFVLCWFLYFIRLILFSYDVDVSCNVQFVRLLLAHSNSAINSCLYVAFSQNYRCGAKKIFFKRCCCHANTFILQSTKGTGNCNAISHEQTLNCKENYFSTKL